ncbi:MAG: 2-phospho-L-lactate guanylyltransferase [Hyphomicrobiales bacterium]
MLVPVNEPQRAKGRLASHLSPEQRVALASATLRSVLAACKQAGFETVVLTGDPLVGEIAEEFGVRVLPEEPRRRGLNGQLEGALERLDAPPEGVLILHADLPLAAAAELRRLAEAAPPAPSVTLVSSDDGGTNAMLLRPPGRFPLAYGVGSFEKHRRAAQAAGMTVQVVSSEELSLDLDTPADIERFRARPGASETPAGRMIASFGAPTGGDA